jgi:hypothetical protein
MMLIWVLVSVLASVNSSLVCSLQNGQSVRMQNMIIFPLASCWWFAVISFNLNCFRSIVSPLGVRLQAGCNHVPMMMKKAKNILMS